MIDAVLLFIDELEPLEILDITLLLVDTLELLELLEIALVFDDRFEVLELEETTLLAVAKFELFEILVLDVALFVDAVLALADIDTGLFILLIELESELVLD